MENHSNINNQFIPYNLALELKELGFDEQCIAYYVNNQDKLIFDITGVNNFTRTNYGSVLGKHCQAAPLWQQVFEFFREKYNLHYIIYKNINIDGYDFCEITTDNIINKNSYVTYEEARLECLKKLIELAKEQNVK